MHFTRGLKNFITTKCNLTIDPPSSSQCHEPLVCPFNHSRQYTIHFVKFKANRLGVFYLAKRIDFEVNHFVIVGGDRGLDLGMIYRVDVTKTEARSLTAQFQKEQVAATAANQNGMNYVVLDTIFSNWNQIQECDVMIPRKYIHRLATPSEVNGLPMRALCEAKTKHVCEMVVQRRGVEMGIIDVEYQWCVYWKIMWTDFREVVHLFYCPEESECFWFGRRSIQDIQDEDLAAQLYCVAPYKSIRVSNVVSSTFAATLSMRIISACSNHNGITLPPNDNIPHATLSPDASFARMVVPLGPCGWILKTIIESAYGMKFPQAPFDEKFLNTRSYIPHDLASQLE